jgi:hypothetical protein
LLLLDSEEMHRRTLSISDICMGRAQLPVVPAEPKYTLRRLCILVRVLGVGVCGIGTNMVSISDVLSLSILCGGGGGGRPLLYHIAWQ